ncbi:MAG: hypothetical protein LCH53_04545 [Bacteroidetes bacterium]|nr:hypothetical protein [Bacteroidota bacterium]
MFTLDDLRTVVRDEARAAVADALRGELPNQLRVLLRGELDASPRSGLVTVGEYAKEMGVHANAVSRAVRGLQRYSPLGIPDAGGRYLRRADLDALGYSPKPRRKRRTSTTRRPASARA